ncbi:MULTISPECIES: L-malyl-CoA/beta-methylmalyl-CoA lyase [Halomicrobium]|uniref:HpcH/HpaI aldolase n=2 Tax=Halomicrobium mukohataei TaxID=57705 RepID=C7P1J9_HALMD|nr:MULTISPECIES: L-malyl-CoA/beta-methylmalyl-CoA lyase [Halomicrobium]ACV49089.1 HpcH/HpaI aldolase [Halomicrobium mukohataei DSM 12286]QCD64505.1 citrate lyase subunit beta [Halomicrobium mukohataei]QFR19311.1 citrate lyase subunit beta [Halomicrobium sp. ZPS1]
MTRLCRTFQTAPAAVPRENSAKYLDSGLTAEGFEAPDWLAPDIEDGTAPSMKAEALENTIDRLPEYGPDFGGEIWPRVEWSYADPSFRERGVDQIDRLVGEAGDHLDGVVVPKVGRRTDVERARSAVAEAEREHGYDDGSIGLSVIVETARAFSDLREIARLGEDSRLTGLIFGPVDYTAELGGRAMDGERPQWAAMLERLSNEASAAGLLAVGGPFDQLFHERAGVTYYNAPGYADQVTREATIGIDGSWSLHPKQTVQANRIHMPTAEELERDVGKIERFVEAKAEGSGAVVLDGQMVDEATYKNFANTVATVRAIDEAHPEQTADRYDGDLVERARAVELGFEGST